MLKKTTLHLCTSQAWGGLELYACTTMVELQKRGWKVWAICYPQSKVEEYLKAHNVLVLNVPGYSKLNLLSVRFIKSLLKEEEISVVHVHFHRDIWQASFALQGDRTRKLLMSIYMGVNKKRDIFHRFIYSRVDAIMTSSIEMNKVMHERYPVPASKIHFLPYGRNVEDYRREETQRSKIRGKYGIETSDVVIGTMMRIDPGKCVMDVIESYSYLKPELQKKVKLLIVGEPTRKRASSKNESPFEAHCEDYYFQIKEYIKKNNFERNIHLCGFQGDIIGYLSAMDVFVFPSRDELFSLVVLDALAMKLPVIAAAAGGNLHQVFDGVNGRLYKVNDVKDMAEKIAPYITDEKLRARHGDAAREFVIKHHSMEKSVDTLLKFY